MLHILIIRKPGDQYAHGHISADGCDRVFCGMAIPQVILEMWDDPRNPYKGKGNVSCLSCLTEWNAGRTDGYRTVVGDNDTTSVGHEGAMEDPKST